VLQVENSAPWLGNQNIAGHAAILAAKAESGEAGGLPTTAFCNVRDARLIQYKRFKWSWTILLILRENSGNNGMKIITGRGAIETFALTMATTRSVLHWRGQTTAAAVESVTPPGATHLRR